MHPSRPRNAGFTLIELLIVISIIGVLAAALLPRILEGRATANAFADRTNLEWQFDMLQIYKNKLKHYPTEGGHKFLLDCWVKPGIFEHTEEAFDRYFTPGSRDQDPTWIEKRKQVEDKVNPWPDLNSVSSLDTHYAARAKDHIRNLESANEAWAANDNEGGWSLQDGTVNVLFGGRNIRTLSVAQLAEKGMHSGNLEDVFLTWGPQSPHPDLQKLDK